MAETLNANVAGGRKTARVSVVIPCYCCHHTIENAVASVVGQTWLPVEIILVDDCSNDDGLTLRALEAIKQRHSVAVDFTVLSLTTNKGAGEARNAGWDVATQYYIAFLDADDSWHPEKLERQFAWMSAHPDYSLSCHQTSAFDEATARAPITLPSRSTDVHRLPLLLTNSIPTRSVMVSRSIAHRFPQHVRHAEDYWLWLQIVFDGGKATKMALPLAYSYKSEFGEKGLSANLSAMHRGVLSSFDALRFKGKVSRTEYVLAVAVETIKYWWRRARVFSRNFSK